MSTPSLPPPPDTEDLRGLARSLRLLLEIGVRTLSEDTGPSELARRVTGHLGCELSTVVSVAERFPKWEHVNIQRGIDAYLAAQHNDAEWFAAPGAGQRPHENMLSLISAPEHFGGFRVVGRRGIGVTGMAGGTGGDGIAAASYGTVAIGPEENTEVVTFGLVTATAPDGAPVVIGVRDESQFGPPLCSLEILAAERSAAAAADLRSVEDQEIPKAVRMQEEVGLQSATDGEWRRTTWHMDFIYALGGISKAPGNLAVKFRNPSGTIEWTPAALHVGSKVRLDGTIFGEDFTFLQAHVTTAVPKLTIPSPNMVHYRGGPAMLDPDVYPDMEEFWSDLAAAYADEVQRLGELGCTYLQFDDTSLAYLNERLPQSGAGRLVQPRPGPRLRSGSAKVLSWRGLSLKVRSTCAT